ncbi:MAG: S-layer homology domain-containing protein [Armatimonadota bacterium]|nr:S-layer homology domain-containing protein [Armatimonadota bacterium]
MHRAAVCVTITVALALACGVAWAQDYITDTVDPLAPYMHDLERVYALGIMEGYQDDTFRPDQNVERGELWVAFNRLIDVLRMKGMELPEDYKPYLATYGRGVRDHWGMEAWERMTKTHLIDRRPVALVMDLDAEIKRIEFAELAVGVLRGYGMLQADLAPAEVAIGEEIMVRQEDGHFHFQGAMPRWEMAVALSRLLNRVAPDL